VARHGRGAGRSAMQHRAKRPGLPDLCLNTQQQACRQLALAASSRHRQHRLPTTGRELAGAAKFPERRSAAPAHSIGSHLPRCQLYTSTSTVLTGHAEGYLPSLSLSSYSPEIRFNEHPSPYQARLYRPECGRAPFEGHGRATAAGTCQPAAVGHPCRRR